jgi:hypothetical protein
MTDRDVVAHAAKVFGYEWAPKSYLYEDHKKPLWHLSVGGKHAIAWMMTLYSFMGLRRQEKIREIILAWTAHSGRKYSTRGMRVMAKCHPDKREHAMELCRNCYQKRNTERYKQNPEWKTRRRLANQKWEAKQKGV